MLLEDDLKRIVSGTEFDPTSMVVGATLPLEGTFLYSMLCLEMIAAGMIPPPPPPPLPPP